MALGVKESPRHALSIGGRIELEWSPVDKPVSRDQRLLQDELWKRIADHYDSFLLFLGFFDPSAPLSVSLDYWRKVTGRFTEPLVRTPDLETLRHKATVALTDAEAFEMLTIAPFMPGSEYLNRDLLDDLWSRLNAEYQRQIKSYKGPVADFVRTLSPKVHLLGRVLTTTDKIGTTTNTYDNAGRVTQIVYPGSKTVAYQYDIASQRTRLTYPDSTYITYT